MSDTVKNVLTILTGLSGQVYHILNTGSWSTPQSADAPLQGDGNPNDNYVSALICLSAAMAITATVAHCTKKQADTIYEEPMPRKVVFNPAPVFSANNPDVLNQAETLNQMIFP